MIRTNVVIDEDLVRKVMDTYGLRSKREAIEFALRAVAGEESTPADRKSILDLEGIWSDRSEEELREIYGDKIPRR